MAMGDHPTEFELRAVLAQYADLFHSARIGDPGENSGFSGARVWRVEVGGQSFALRATAHGAVHTQRLRGLHRLLEWVNRLGVPELPAPLIWPASGTFRSSFEHIWQLEPWMPGRADFTERPSRARLQSAVEVLARFHRAAATFTPSPDEKRWFNITRLPSPGLNERLRHALRWNHETCAETRASLLSSEWIEFGTLGIRILELFERAVPKVIDALMLARESEVPLQPCLRDVWHDHLLFTGETVTGLIDAHACRSDCVATDLARLLGTLVGDDAHAWESALQVYQEIRPLSAEERSLIPLFDQSAVLLNGLTWLDWHVRGRIFPHRARVVRRLHDISQRLEHLADR